MTRLLLPLSLILLFSCNVMGQDNPNFIIDTGYAGNQMFWIRTVYPDTVRIIYIGMDTAKVKYPGANSLKQSNGYSVQYPETDPYKIIWMIWSFGYIVYTEKGTYFLMDNKKPIKEPFFIFDYRIIDKPKRAF